MSITNLEAKIAIFKNKKTDWTVYYNACKKSAKKADVEIEGGIYFSKKLKTNIAVIVVKKGRMRNLLNAIDEEIDTLMENEILVGTPADWHEKNWPTSSYSNVAVPGAYISSYDDFNTLYSQWSKNKFKKIKLF